MKKAALLLAIALMLSVVLGACGGASYAPETTETPKNIMQKTDPAEDDTMNILMIGNSFCYYYVEELYGMAKAAGIDMRVCNVYYSGCKLEQHWTWWKNGEAHYQFFVTDGNGRQKTEGTNLEYCLQQGNWDVISLQTIGANLRDGTAQAALDETKLYRTELYDYLKEQFPYAKLFWHQTWAYQIGYDRNGYKMESVPQQTEYFEKIREVSLAICQEQDVTRIPSGEAWQIVREGGYDNLCARLSVNGGEGDYYHDGDIGGGQYLNACVWFEVLTGQSCIGNTYRPDYALSEDLIATLQNAAHQAVQEAQ